MAFGISANPVRDDVHDDDNNSPDFRASKTTRTIPEDTAKGQPVGRPVTVDIKEDRDTLTYELISLQQWSWAMMTRPTTQMMRPLCGSRGGPGHVLRPLRDRQGHGADNYVDKDLDSPSKTAMTASTKSASGPQIRPAKTPRTKNMDDILVTVTASDVNEAPGVRR